MSASAPSPVAELILHGGSILTMENDQPRAEALAVGGGRILAVGEAASVMAPAGPDTRVVDLAGRCLLPGFIDAHGHFMNALQVAAWANVQRPPAGPVTAIADLQAVLQAHAQAQQLTSSDWVIAYGYDPDGLADGRPLELPEAARKAFGTHHNHLMLQGVKLLIDGSPQGRPRSEANLC